MNETSSRILVGKGTAPCHLDLALANRHGLIAGATGTGKTVTLQVLAEGFSRAGVPVFCADVKGDLSGLSQPGEPSPRLEERARSLGVADYRYEPTPVLFWDLFRERGHPLRTTVSEMGPLLLARLLGLNETQEGVLHIAFRIADEQGLLLLDFKDLVAMLQFVADQAKELRTLYGNVGRSSVGAIQRRLLVLEEEGGDLFFGEPALELGDLLLTTPGGQGAVNMLVADRLIRSPRAYATFLLWLLSELFEELPEVGDPDRPKLVFFFDEAHLLFRNAPDALVEKVEQVVRLIRSKGVGVYFVTQNPLDIPAPVLDQLGNRFQHALRAYTPRQQRAVRAAAETFRPNPGFDTAQAITRLEVGEALVSTLEPGGVPSMVDRVRILPPRSRMGAITEEERQRILSLSPLRGKYDRDVDRSSAYERLTERAETVVEPGDPWAGAREAVSAVAPANPWGTGDPTARPPQPVRHPRRRISRSRSARPAVEKTSGGWAGMLGNMLSGGGRRQSVGEAMVKSVARTVGSQIGRAVVRGILGSILKR